MKKWNWSLISLTAGLITFWYLVAMFIVNLSK